MDRWLYKYSFLNLVTKTKFMERVIELLFALLLATFVRVQGEVDATNELNGMNSVNQLNHMYAVEPGFKPLTPQELAKISQRPSEVSSPSRNNIGPLPKLPEFKITFQGDKSSPPAPVIPIKPSNAPKVETRPIPNQPPERDPPRTVTVTKAPVQTISVRVSENPKTPQKSTIINKTPTTTSRQASQPSSKDKKEENKNESKGNKDTKDNNIPKTKSVPKRYQVPKNAGIGGQLGGKVPDPGIAIPKDNLYKGSSFATSLNASFSLALFSLVLFFLLI